ncbi:hypothetical protein F5884DRAFT_789732 [Xylogone sp. PMI_703]|nr:hypothetical protein F5884DRAFT_789732 [Xylogone sp. PMI_703]
MTTNGPKREQYGEEVPEGTFHKFPELPAEIQLKIWDLAVPDPRGLFKVSAGVIVVVLDLKLTKVRGIFPPIRELKDIYKNQRRSGDGEYDDDDHLEYWDGFYSRMKHAREPVMSLLQTCRKSRAVALDNYRLVIDSIVPNEAGGLWKEGEIAYFYPIMVPWEMRLDDYLFLSPTPSGSIFDSLQHVAVNLTRSNASRLGIMDDVDNEYAMQPVEMMGPNDSMSLRLLKRFPSLQSLILLLDPGSQLDIDGNKTKEIGRIALYESEDVPVNLIGHQRPSKIVKRATQILESSTPEGRDAPLVELYVGGIIHGNEGTE